MSVFLICQGFLCVEDNALNAEILEAVLDMNGATCVIYPDGQKLVDSHHRHDSKCFFRGCAELTERRHGRAYIHTS